ncbi:MAG: hypothetical protein IPJ20_15190 [Flammeovirgaceae bacterium]|nr:hypothetical protein [Flammeovirgaceae bacterium]
MSAIDRQNLPAAVLKAGRNAMNAYTEGARLDGSNGWGAGPYWVTTRTGSYE